MRGRDELEFDIGGMSAPNKRIALIFPLESKSVCGAPHEIYQVVPNC